MNRTSAKKNQNSWFET